MPHEVRRKGNRYQVVNTETGEVKSTTTKKKAEKQVRLLRGIEKGWTPTAEPNVYTRKIGNKNVKLRLTGGSKRGTKR